MRIIVIADTHGNYAALKKIILRNFDADWIIHLGDGEKEVEEFSLKYPQVSKKIVRVAGNCDYESMQNDVVTLPVTPEHRIFITHGHKYNVYTSTDDIKKHAHINGCDIVLFGHTHARYMAQEDGMYIMNPGSASCPRDGNKPSFGHIDISPAGIMMNIVDI